MKKFSILMIFLLSLSFVSYGNNKIKEVTDTVKSKVAKVDTSTTYKLMYHDFKAGLESLGAALKVGSEHVYEILVRQQLVNSITWLLVGILPLLIFIIFAKKMWYFADNWQKTQNEVEGFGWCLNILFWIFTLLPGIIGLFNISEIVTGFVNPEYGAIQEIIKFVK